MSVTHRCAALLIRAAHRAIRRGRRFLPRRSIRTLPFRPVASGLLSADHLRGDRQREHDGGREGGELRRPLASTTTTHVAVFVLFHLCVIERIHRSSFLRARRIAPDGIHRGCIRVRFWLDDVRRLTCASGSRSVGADRSLLLMHCRRAGTRRVVGGALGARRHSVQTPLLMTTRRGSLRDRCAAAAPVYLLLSIRPLLMICSFDASTGERSARFPKVDPLPHLGEQPCRLSCLGLAIPAKRTSYAEQASNGRSSESPAAIQNRGLRTYFGRFAPEVGGHRNAGGQQERMASLTPVNARPLSTRITEVRRRGGLSLD